MKTTYYLPSGGGASSAVGGCSGGESRLEIPLPGAILLGVQAYPTDAYGKSTATHGGYRVHAEAMKIYLTFKVPSGQRVQLTSNKFLLKENLSKNQKEVVLPGFQVQRREISATDELRGSSQTFPSMFGTYTETAFYAGHYITVGVAPSEFQLTLPPLLVNGTEVKIPPLAFQLREEYVMTGICP